MLKNIQISPGIIKYINIYRCINLIKLYLSYIVSSIFRKALITGMPWSVSIEPTNLCNLKCPECPTGNNTLTRPTGSIDIELYRKIIKQSSKTTFYLNLYFQGEPFLHRNISDLIRVAKENRVYVSCSTNAHHINTQTAKEIISAGLDQIIISFDGTSQESYEKYRVGGKLSTVIKSIETLVEQRKKLNKRKPLIFLQFLVLKHNIDQISEAKQVAKKLGVDKIEFKTAQLYNLENSNPFFVENKEYSRYEKLPDGKLQLKQKIKRNCWKAWSSCVISWDGSVAPCCFDKNTDYCYGNLNKTTFYEIINSEKAKNFKTTLIRNRKSVLICSNCMIS